MPGRIIPVNAAVGSTEDDLYFTNNTKSSSTNHVVSAEEKADSDLIVKQVKLDNLKTEVPIKAMKIDVEGFEEEVLLGAKELLKSNDLQIVILEDFNGKESSSYKIMKEYGYSRCRYLINQNTIVRDDAFTGNGTNSIYVKDVDLCNGIIEH